MEERKSLWGPWRKGKLDWGGDLHLAIGLDTVFEAVKLPAGVTNLDTGLTDVERDDFAHGESDEERVGRVGE